MTWTRPLWLPRIWPAAASGILAVACFPPLRFSPLVFVALVPLLLYLRECDGRRAFRSGMLFGFIFWLGEFSFVAQFVSKWTGSLLMGVVPYLLGSAIVGLYFGLFGWLAAICCRRSLIWAVPFAWAGVEVFRSYLAYLAFPYGLLAAPLTGMPAIIQSAHYGTIYLVSAWIVLANVIVAELLAKQGLRAVRWHLVCLGAVLALSLFRYSSEPVGVMRRVVAGQPGVDLAFGDENTKSIRVGRA